VVADILTKSIGFLSACSTRPTVSIVLPVYNGEDYLKESINSILGQTYKDFELVIINDGSTDTSQKIIDSFNDLRIVKIKQANMGLVATLNIGISKARGKFIARQDADDISQPLRLQRQVEMMHKYFDLAAVGTMATVIDGKGRATDQYDYPKSDAALRLALFSYNPIVHGSMMIRSATLKVVGVYDPSTYPAEDYDLWRRLVRHGKIMNIDERLYSYRRHEGGVSLSNQDRQTEELLNVRKKYFGHSYFILKNPLTVRRALGESPELASTVWLLLRVSALRLRPLNFLFLLISIVLALPKLAGGSR